MNFERLVKLHSMLEFHHVYLLVSFEISTNEGIINFVHMNRSNSFPNLNIKIVTQIVIRPSKWSLRPNVPLHVVLSCTYVNKEATCITNLMEAMKKKIKFSLFNFNFFCFSSFTPLLPLPSILIFHSFHIKHVHDLSPSR